MKLNLQKFSSITCHNNPHLTSLEFATQAYPYNNKPYMFTTTQLCTVKTLVQTQIMSNSNATKQ